MRFLLLSLVMLTVYPSAWGSQSLTTPDLRNIFMHRCRQFGRFPKTAIIYKPNSFTKRKCERYWNKFSRGVAYKDPCDVNQKSFRPFLEALNKRLARGLDTFKNNVSVRSIYVVVKCS